MFISKLLDPLLIHFFHDVHVCVSVGAVVRKIRDLM